MTREEIEKYGAILDLTGLKFASRQFGGGSVKGIVELDWETVITVIVSKMNWTIVDSKEEKEVRSSILRIDRT